MSSMNYLQAEMSNNSKAEMQKCFNHRGDLMNKVTTNLWDAAEHLETKEDMAAYLEAALQDGDPQFVAAALGDIARAKGMSQFAREAGG